MGRRGRAAAQTMLQEQVMTTVSPIPPGFRSVTPHMTIKNAGEAMDFYVKAFGAVEISRFPMPGMDLLAPRPAAGWRFLHYDSRRVPAGVLR